MALAMGSDEPRSAGASRADGEDLVRLPAVASTSTPLDDALRRRRSMRSFAARALSREQLGQLCWAAQGITEPARGLRTAPSAGGLYPLEVYVVVPGGVFHYEPRGHRLRRIGEADRRGGLARAALGQEYVGAAPLDLVITGATSRLRGKYGERAERYVHVEAGHAAQNVLLEATALGLGAVPVGAFDDEDVRSAVGAPSDEVPLYIVAIGHPAS